MSSAITPAPLTRSELMLEQGVDRRAMSKRPTCPPAGQPLHRYSLRSDGQPMMRSPETDCISSTEAPNALGAVAASLASSTTLSRRARRKALTSLKVSVPHVPPLWWMISGIRSRRGADLWRVETISVPDAVLGTALEMATLEGSTTVTIPAGTQPGSILRLGGRGLPRFDGRGRGDLSVPDELLVELEARRPG